MSKLRVGVLRGGPSHEYDVSLQTGGTILKHLAEDYYPQDILITKNGLWHINGLERSPDNVLRHVDVVINALHGAYGEDGKVQNLLDTYGVAYTGSGALASALGMNKLMTKKLAKQHGIKTPLHTTVDKGDDINEKAVHIFKTFPQPSVVKPINSGSSIGVRVAYTIPDLVAALEHALAHAQTAIVEEYITGREATCGVIDSFRDTPVYALIPLEVERTKGSALHDYASKYAGENRISHGNFTEKESRELQEVSAKIHQVLGIKHYSRSDFIVNPRRGVYFLEVNTLPGLTEQSLFPKSLEAVGSSLPHFLKHLISLALERK